MHNLHNIQKGTIILLTLSIKLLAAIYVITTNYDAILKVRSEGHMTTTTQTKATKAAINTLTAEIITEAVVQEMLLCITDNGGATFDRYSIYFKDGSVLGLSDQPTSSQGYSQWSECDSKFIGDIHTTEVRETPIAFADFPHKEHVISRVREAYKDYVVFCKQSNASPSEIRKGILKDYAKFKH